MKKLIVGLLWLALLTGCGSSPPPSTSEEEIPPETFEPEATVPTRRVSYEFNCVNMSLELPEDWEYCYVGTPVNDGELHVPPADCLGIRFWPREDRENSVGLYHYADGFGVCGTGLETEKITLGGMSAIMGTYDNSGIWSYIVLEDTPGSYVFINEGMKSPDRYLSILDSVQVGEGFLKRSEAVALAEEVCTVEYDTVWAAFNRDQGDWKIDFFLSRAAGGGQTVWLERESDVDGTDYMVSIDYGE